MPMLECSQSQNALLRQAAVYGVRVVAEQCPQQFAQFVAPVLAVLMTLIRAGDAKEGDNLGATENAICALGTICTLYGGKHPNVNLGKKKGMGCVGVVGVGVVRTVNSFFFEFGVVLLYFRFLLFFFAFRSNLTAFCGAIADQGGRRMCSNIP